MSRFKQSSRYQSSLDLFKSQHWLTLSPISGIINNFHRASHKTPTTTRSLEFRLSSRLTRVVVHTPTWRSMLTRSQQNMHSHKSRLNRWHETTSIFELAQIEKKNTFLMDISLKQIHSSIPGLRSLGWKVIFSGENVKYVFFIGLNPMSMRSLCRFFAPPRNGEIHKLIWHTLKQAN